MAQHRKSTAGIPLGPSHAESDALRNAYTINVHSTEGGQMHILLARMNISSRRYQFTALPTLAIPVDQPVSLAQGVRYVANLIECDDETEWYTL